MVTFEGYRLFLCTSGLIRNSSLIPTLLLSSSCYKRDARKRIVSMKTSAANNLCTFLLSLFVSAQVRCLEPMFDVMPNPTEVHPELWQYYEKAKRDRWT